MRKIWDDGAWDEYLYWQENNKKMLKKINELIRDIERNGYSGVGKPVPLRHNLAGYWSKRITDKDRLVFKIEDQTIFILSCKGHYFD